MAQEELDIVVIDNYDSFTWNIVEYLSSLTERNITVIRNDKISVAELEARHPKLLVISPGPGHPDTDSGISSDCIRAFAGKIPILGVCMGLQCMFTVFGGIVEGTGEILHGKTSLVEHDGKGLYTGVPQKIAATRYHSLAGTHASLPDCLERTSWTENGIIMGVRHKEYAIEGVQYHPESILSEGGKLLLANFLKLEAGTWAGNPGLGETMPSTEKKKTILETIHEQRLVDITEAKATPGATQADLTTLLSLNVAPPLIDFKKRLTQNAPMEPALMAEIKRASPSKGDIDITANAASQALLYARGGASVISVLTEPKWFKGSLNDLRAVRDVLETMPNRPALLRKDFIIDTYQIDEARLYGADTVLLIVAMLSKDNLQKLYTYARGLDMEPLVEVNNPAEMAIAMEIGAQVVGVNNRNLHDFNVDLNTTSNLAKDLQRGVVLCALSGISTRADVTKYVDEGVGAVLVGEALMRSKDKGAFIATLLGRPELSNTVKQKRIVKICGTRTAAGAVAAAEAGADLIGIIFVEDRKRTLSIDQAKEVIAAVRALPARQDAEPITLAQDWFSQQAGYIAACTRPLIVGVFQNQSLETILHYKAILGLDVIQLHGQEPISWAGQIPGPVIKVFGVGDTGSAMSKPGYHALPLIDSVSTNGTRGGTGSQVDLEGAAEHAKRHGNAFILAGGLTPETVASAIQQTGCLGVDVSSGVEDDNGEQSPDKIAAFVRAARQA